MVNGLTVEDGNYSNLTFLEMRVHETLSDDGAPNSSNPDTQSRSQSSLI